MKPDNGPSEETPAAARGRVTEVLQELQRGEPGAREDLFRIVYGELRRVADTHMRGQREGHTLQPTALVHEVYLRMMGTPDPSWEDRAHFFGTAAKAMRSILVDFARSRRAQKRGGGRARITFNDAEHGSWERADELIALHDALSTLETIEPEWSRVVELRFFGGLDVAEVARVTGAHERTVYRAWNAARAWLYRELAR